MSDQQHRQLFRDGLAPLVEDVPKGPEWDELIADAIVTAAPHPRQPSRWLVGSAVSAVVVGLIVAAALLSPAPPPTDPGETTTPPTNPVFDEAAAAGDVEIWWSHVLAFDLTAAVDMSHPDAVFNFGGLSGAVSGLGRDVGVSAEREVFGTDQQPMLCYTLEGNGGAESGAAVFRQHDGEWLIWEIRPGTVGCMDDSPITTLPAVEGFGRWTRVVDSNVGSLALVIKSWPASRSALPDPAHSATPTPPKNHRRDGPTSPIT